MAKKGTEYYVSSAEIREEIDKHRKKPPGTQMSDELGIIFMKIANGLASRPSYINYTFKEEFISDAISKMIMYLDRIDTSKHLNQFGYLNMIAYHCFLQKIAKEKKYSQFKDTLADITWSELDPHSELDETNKERF